MDPDVDIPMGDYDPAVFQFYFEGGDLCENDLMVIRPLGLLNRIVRKRNMISLDFDALENVSVFLLECASEAGAETLEEMIDECVAQHMSLIFSVGKEGQTPDIIGMTFVEPEQRSFAVQASNPKTLESLKCCARHPNLPVWSPPDAFWARYAAWLLPGFNPTQHGP
jgi:hypothetical protein